MLSADGRCCAAADGPTRTMSIFDPASPSASRSSIWRSWFVDHRADLRRRRRRAALLASGAFASPPGDDTTEPPQVYGSMPIEIAWTAAPALIVFFLVLVTTRTLWEVERQPAAAAGRATTRLFVTVIGHQWWWEYVYESYDGRKLGFITANELHMPVERGRHAAAGLPDAEIGRRLPQLLGAAAGGKMDLIPGRTNSLWFQTDEPGLFLGQCAEYCGTQHANMLLRVIVDSPDDFERWLAESSAGRPWTIPRCATGKAAFLAQSCVNCHRVRGTPAHGTYAPDLTHLMSRADARLGHGRRTRRRTCADWVARSAERSSRAA